MSVGEESIDVLKNCFLKQQLTDEDIIKGNTALVNFKKITINGYDESDSDTKRELFECVLEELVEITKHAIESKKCNQ